MHNTDTLQLYYRKLTEAKIMVIDKISGLVIQWRFDPLNKKKKATLLNFLLPGRYGLYFDMEHNKI